MIKRNDVMVSIVCMCYNHEKYIGQTLDSFLMQETDFPFEILVHDDASTDRSSDIIRAYAKAYPNIVKPIIQTVNQFSQGVDIKNTFVVPCIKGKYVALCEGDDFWIDKTKLQRQIVFLENNLDYTSCVHNTKIYNCKKKKYCGCISKHKEDYDVELGEVLRRGSYAYQTSSLVMRAKYYISGDKVEYFNYAKGFGDWPYSILLCLEGKMRFLYQKMSVYRLFSAKSSWSSDTNGQLQSSSFDNAILMLNLLRKYVPNENISDINKAILRQEYYRKVSKNDFKAIVKKPYIQFLKEETVKRRIYFYIRGKLPFLGKIIAKLFKK